MNILRNHYCPLCGRPCKLCHGDVWTCYVCGPANPAEPHTCGWCAPRVVNRAPHVADLHGQYDLLSRRSPRLS